MAAEGSRDVPSGLRLLLPLRRLLGTLRPERPRIIAVMVLTSIAVVANVVQPKILGSMTDLLFTGLLSMVLGPLVGGSARGLLTLLGIL